MNAYKLIRLHEDHHPESKYFSRENLRFFGERISEMYVLKGTVMVDGRECWVLSTRQRNAPEGVPQRRHHYFDVNTFEHVYV